MRGSGFARSLSVVAVAVSLGAWSPCLAQTVVVGVEDAVSHVLLSNADVAVRGTTLLARTDSLGCARLAGLRAGDDTIDVHRIGYAPLSAALHVDGRDSVEVIVSLRPAAQELAAVEVMGSTRSVWLSEFEARRRRASGGHFLTEATIRASVGSTIADLVGRTIPGVRIEQRSRGSGAGVFSTRGGTGLARGACQVAVYLDGVRLSDGDAALAPLEELGGIEYYPAGLVPAQYRTMDAPNSGSAGSAACGVMLLWRR
jgi:hypothetical protein